MMPADRAVPGDPHHHPPRVYEKGDEPIGPCAGTGKEERICLDEYQIRDATLMPA